MNYNLVKTKVQMFFIKLFGGLKPNNNEVNLEKFRNTYSNVLFIFPLGNEDIKLSFMSVQNIIKVFHEKGLKYNFLIDRKFQSSIKLYNASIFYLDTNKRGKIINKNKLISELKTEKYDLIIDLNKNFNLAISIIVNKLDAEYKIGSVSKFSDSFYNIQYSSSINDSGQMSHIEQILGLI
tara:strand:+ start:543 stop:1082 length:540 start_codon:yes stop_codon:yes gene_type:complete